MANSQNLNPAGYLINDNPMNVNPFFDWGGGEVDPTILERVSTLETEMAEANEDIADLEGAMAEIPNTYATQTELGQGLSNLNTGIQQQLTSINGNFDNYYTKGQTYTKAQVEALIPDMTDYYTKQQTDALIPDMTDYYTKSQVDNLIPDTSILATKTELTTGLAGKVDNATLNDYYTKQQTDALIPDTSNLATKTELATGLAGKVDNTDLTNYYTKTQVDNLIPDLTNYYTKSQTDALIPDMTNYYTKTQIDGLLPDMTLYYQKSETYSKTEIDNMIGAAITALEAI